MKVIVMKTHCHVIPGCRNCKQAPRCPSLDLRIREREEWFLIRGLESAEPLLTAVILGDSTNRYKEQARKLLQLLSIKNGERE